MQLVTEDTSQLSEVSIPDAEALEFSDTNQEFTTWPCNLFLTKILLERILIALRSRPD